jgi:ribosome biogenesis protein SSF1/2
MPRRGRRRRKHRTHVEGEDTIQTTLILRRGKVGPVIKHLIAELRIVFYPNTPVQIQEGSKQSLGDILEAAKANEANHLLLFSSTANSTYLKAVCLPAGPTVTYKVDKFTLASDVSRSASKRVTLQKDFKSHALLVSQGLTSDITKVVFQALVPNLDPSSITLKKCRRVVLLVEEDGVLQFRHYLVKQNPGGISKSLKKLARSEVPNLNSYQDVSDWVLKSTYASDSEAEDLAVAGNSVNIRLHELGPRMTLRMHKVQQGICSDSTQLPTKRRRPEPYPEEQRRDEEDEDYDYDSY